MPNQISFVPVPTYSRLPKPATGEDGFFAHTLASPITIPTVHTFRNSRLDTALPSQPPASSWPSPTASPQLIPVSVELHDPNPAGATATATANVNVDENANAKPKPKPKFDDDGNVTTGSPCAPADLLMLVRLASPGVCGHPGTAHGGVLATVLDEAMSLGVTLYAPEAGEGVVQTVSQRDQGQGQGQPKGRIRSKMFTAQLDVRYKKAVSVPGDVEVRVKVLAKQGKKVWVRAQVVQGEEIMVDALAFWLLTLTGKSLL